MTYLFKSNGAMHNGTASITCKIHQFLAIFQHVGFLHAFLDGEMKLATFRGKFILGQYSKYICEQRYFLPSMQISTNSYSIFVPGIR